MFRASCCSARLSQAQVPVFAGSSVRDRGKKRGMDLGWGGGGGGSFALAGAREQQQSNWGR